MKAGPELDALIARELMNENLEVVVFVKSKYGNHSEIHPKQPKPYSTCIKSAWEVAEGFARVEIEKNSSDKWRCILYTKDFKSIGEASGLNAAPHAICLAALKAVGVKIES